MIGAEEHMAELFRRVEGERVTWWRRVVSGKYSSQIAAIRELGDTGMLQALEYLKTIATPEVTKGSIVETVGMAGQGSGDCNPYSEDVYVSVEHYRFPNAHGPLQVALGYTIPLTRAASNSGYATTFDRSPTEVQEDHSKAMARDPHKTLNAAISKLEAKLLR